MLYRRGFIDGRGKIGLLAMARDTPFGQLKKPVVVGLALDGIWYHVTLPTGSTVAMLPAHTMAKLRYVVNVTAAGAHLYMSGRGMVALGFDFYCRHARPIEWMPTVHPMNVRLGSRPIEVHEYSDYL